LGEGGMGSVYLGYDEQQKRHVALKVLPVQLATNPSYVERFYREAQNAASLEHPNIVQGLGSGRDEATGMHYLVLEYVDGPSVHSLLERCGKLPVGDAVHIVLDIARGLEHAHSRNIIHRDIKPDNLLLTRSGVAKLSDLGLAKRTDAATHLTGPKQSFGTPHYMPYEQALDAKKVDRRSDLYALGATLYHLVTGELPFTGANPMEVVEKKNVGSFRPASALHAEVPEALDRVLDKLLAKDPGDRYQSAGELIADLEKSRLASPVPSFVDANLSLEARALHRSAVTAVDPTHLDLASGSQQVGSAPSLPSVWYLRYRNRAGEWCKARANTQQIAQRLREGRLPSSLEASHGSQGTYLPLSAYPEFRQFAKQETHSGEPGQNGAHRPRPRGRLATPEVAAPTSWLFQPAWILPILLTLLGTLAAIVYFALHQKA
jgi:serine/threonine-protein kinase